MNAVKLTLHQHGYMQEYCKGQNVKDKMTAVPEQKLKIMLGNLIGFFIEQHGSINCMVLTEGTDLLVCDAVINLRPTCNVSLYQQIIGRGTRLYDGKDYCLVIGFRVKKKILEESLLLYLPFECVRPDPLTLRNP